MYRGTAAFSEPETRAVRDFFKKLCCVVGAIDFHSYSQWILIPSVEDSPRDRELNIIAKELSKTIKRVTGKYYDPGYVTKGSASNFFYVARPGQEWVASLTIEVRPDENSRTGFLLPKSEIIPTGRELFAAFLTLAEIRLRDFE